ncbi:MAG TPA: PAS domain-containing protein [Nitrospirae bacterium]|nr:sporulation kinase E [bacterium BMS3Abin06]HDH12434.1 PAS domain-containing protein [Nitrospirota bacterium]HDZ02429.1 PAS domain-containing protein [Nitrospirota bacterium]
MAVKSELKESFYESYEQFRQLVETSPFAIGAECDDEIVLMNSAGARLLGATGPEQVTGKSILDFIHPDYKEIVKRQFQQVREVKTAVNPFDLKINRADGTNIDIEIAATHFTCKNKTAVQFTFHEISERKKMEELLFQSKQDWEDIFHTITDMITVHDRDFNIIYANRAAREILKMPPDGRNIDLKCFKYYHGAGCPPDGCPSCDSLKSGEPANSEIFEPHLNMFIEIRSMPRFDSNNQLIGLIHIARDVSERKRAEKAIKLSRDELELRVEERTSALIIANEHLKDEIAERKTAVEALQKSEKKYRDLSREFDTLLNGIPDNLILLSPDLKIMWANNAAASVIQNNDSGLKGQYCYSMCCNILSPCENCPTLRSFSSGKEETAEISTSKDKIWDIRAFPIKDETGRVKSVIELARDITEKVNLQAGATRTRHLASLGELAAGVAHEINNPVNNVINYAQILIDEFEKENRDDDIARRIVKDGERIAAIVKSLLSFARIRKEEKCLMYLHEIFSETLSLASAQIKKDGIHLKVGIPREFIKISVHPQQIQQVFLNIISNSRFALNQKYPGTHEDKILEITCEKIMIENDPYVRIVFHDHGTGIPAGVIDKVVNPFFSTKPDQMGTGLGLSISHGIISEHGGKFLINSVEGKFTKTTINLPIDTYSEE